MKSLVCVEERICKDAVRRHLSTLNCELLGHCLLFTVVFPHSTRPHSAMMLNTYLWKDRRGTSRKREEERKESQPYIFFEPRSGTSRNQTL